MVVRINSIVRNALPNHIYLIDEAVERAVSLMSLKKRIAQRSTSSITSRAC
jgi:cobalamin biosynthesis Mg chelatase CobN